MADHVRQQIAAPGDTSLQQAEAQLRKALQHAAEDQRLGEDVAGAGEMADMVEGEVIDRGPAFPPHGTGVRRHGDAKVGAGLPDRIVVVGTLQRQAVDVIASRRIIAAGRGTLLAVRVERAAHVIGDHHRLHAELAHRMAQLGDGLVRRMHRDRRDRGQAVRIRPEHFDVHLVQRAADGAPQVCVRQRALHQAERRIDDGEIDAEFVEPFVHQPRHHRRRPVAGFRRLAPPGRSAGTAGQPFLARQTVPAVLALLVLAESVDHRSARLGLQKIEEDRHRLQPMPIRIDHRMGKLGADFRGCRTGSHGPFLIKPGHRPAPCGQVSRRS